MKDVDDEKRWCSKKMTIMMIKLIIMKEGKDDDEK